MRVYGEDYYDYEDLERAVGFFELLAFYGSENEKEVNRSGISSFD